MSECTNIVGLIGKDLAGFKIVQMSEVYEVDVDGRKVRPRGLFKDSSLADVFIGLDSDGSWLRAKPALVLTDGIVAYPIEDQESVNILDDESGMKSLTERIRAKLSPAERRMIGFE